MLGFTGLGLRGLGFRAWGWSGVWRLRVVGFGDLGLIGVRSSGNPRVCTFSGDVQFLVFSVDLLRPPDGSLWTVSLNPEP